MTNAFVARKPWATVLVSFLFSSFAGLLYLGKGKWALRYLAVSIVVISVPFCLAHFTVISIDPRRCAHVLLSVLQCAGTAFCYFLAKHQPDGVTKWYSRWYNIILLTIALPLGIVLPIRFYFYEPFTTSSISMEPTLTPDDYFFIDKQAYGVKHLPQRGDIVVFNVHTKGRVVQSVKRIMGMPGDYVEIQDSVISINGTSVGQDMSSASYPNLIQPHQIPADQYFFVGDNRDNAYDSRNGVGDVPIKDFIGKAIAIIWNAKTYKFSYRPIM